MILAALANRHRREIVQAVALHPHAISTLAAQQCLSLPAMHKHVAILEGAGLVSRRKSGRTTYLALRRGALLHLGAWLGGFRPGWGTDAETLENYRPYLERGHDPKEERP